MQLGENIYRYRVERGLSQGGLADALEVSRQSVSKWENNSAVPELDKLMRMSRLFNVTLDELVYGKKEQPKAAAHSPAGLSWLSPRLLVGCTLLLFGMIFFLLSVFWGDQLYFGEEFGELVSLSIVLISLAMIATYNQLILATCAIIYVVYSFVCAGILHMTSFTNHIFMFLAGIVLLVWFLVLGLRANKETEAKEPTDSEQEETR